MKKLLLCIGTLIGVSALHAHEFRVVNLLAQPIEVQLSHVACGPAITTLGVKGTQQAQGLILNTRCCTRRIHITYTGDDGKQVTHSFRPFFKHRGMTCESWNLVVAKDDSGRAQFAFVSDSTYDHTIVKHNLTEKYIGRYTRSGRRWIRPYRRARSYRVYGPTYYTVVEAL